MNNLDPKSNNWISVKDKLPECPHQHRMDYESGSLLTWDGFEVEIASYWEFDDGRKEWSSGSDVTHYMPLPKPPEL